MSGPFYIADMRASWRRNPYITFWRPENKGYAYPLVWAGKYVLEQLEYGYHYAFRYGSKEIERCPISCDTIERLGIPPIPGHVDRDAGPVVPNTAAIRKFIRDNAFAAIPHRVLAEAAGNSNRRRTDVEHG